MAKDALVGRDVSAILAQVSEHVDKLVELMATGSRATIREVLEHLRVTGLAKLDERLLGYMGAMVQAERTEPKSGGDAPEDDGQLAQEVTAMAAYLSCPAVQLWGYKNYVDEESPFSTQQGIKGAEFDRVLTVLDDDEGRHFTFSYNKYFGMTPPSANDLDRERRGEETVIDRTQRLFYVCCTRALQDLAVVLFAENVGEAVEHVRAKAFFDPRDILTEKDLTEDAGSSSRY